MSYCMYLIFLQVEAALREKYQVILVLLPTNISLTQAHHSLPPLLPHIVDYTTKNKSFAHASLFDCYAALFIQHYMLKASPSRSSSSDPFPAFPSMPAGPYLQTTKVIMEALQDDEHPMPVYFKFGGSDLPNDVYKALGDILLPWIKESLRYLMAGRSLSSEEPTPKHVFLLIRTTAFFYRAIPDVIGAEGHAIYRGLQSVLAARCIYKYCANIIQPILRDIQLSMGDPFILSLGRKLASLVQKWVHFFPALAEDNHKVPS